jgi:hypothetical protein
LKRVLDQTIQGGLSKIDVKDLETFYEKSLLVDNFDGLGHLMNYVQLKNVDVSSWNVSKFRPALDYYLNHSFDINKILTFLRFYVAFAQGNLKQTGLSSNVELSEENKALAFNKVFG